MARRVSPSSQAPMEALEDYVEKTLGKVIQCQTHLRRGYLIRGITIEEGFLYEIMQLCLVITLTSSYKLRKIRGIQKQKEKRLTRSLPFS
jgi:hypothetical protein